jgi:hypothetical protein
MQSIIHRDPTSADLAGADGSGRNILSIKQLFLDYSNYNRSRCRSNAASSNFEGPDEGRDMQSIRHLAQWLSTTSLSGWFGDNSWVIPISQSIHIICVAVVLCSATVVSMRLLGIGKAGRSTSQAALTLLPWMYRALVVLLCTGLVQIIAEPVRQFVTPQFWWKMLLIAAILAMTMIFKKSVRANPLAWDSPSSRPGVAKTFAVVSVAMWATIVVLGRLIGYTWSFHV